jgi:hypothetical protein
MSHNETASSENAWARFVLEHGVHSNVRAGISARTAEDELGVVMGARVSPDGRWIAVLDAVRPRVKVIGGADPLAQSFHVDRGTSALEEADNVDQLSDSSAIASFVAARVRPVIAISNQRLLVMWPDSIGNAQFFDLTGRPMSNIGGVDFTPISATAITDTTWLVYGPSSAKIRGQSTWIHCLYLHAHAPSAWRSTLVDDVLQEDGIDPPTLSESHGVVFFEHNQRLSTTHGAEGSVIISARCGNGIGQTPQVTILAAGTGKFSPQAEHTSFRYGDAVERSGFGILSDSDMTATVAQTAPRNAWTAVLRLINPNTRPSGIATVFETLSAGTSKKIVVPGDYEMLDCRTEVGALFMVDQPTPRIFLVPISSFARLLR